MKNTMLKIAIAVTSIGVVVLIALVGAKLTSASSTPIIKTVGSDTGAKFVTVEYMERKYTAHFLKGALVTETLVDERLGARCQPNVLIGSKLVLDYHCDEHGNLEKYPEVHHALDELPQGIIDDFTLFRKLAAEEHQPPTR